MIKRRRKTHFVNNKDIGAYVDIRFEIRGDTELGRETIQFETKVHYLEKGEGQTLLLVHGIGQSLYTWHKNIDFFAQNGFRVIAVDLPGFGYSGHPAIYYTIEEYKMIIAAFLNAMKIKKTHIAAFSTGCLAAVCFAAQHPERVGRLVFVSPGGPNENYPFFLRAMTTWLGHTLIRAFMSESCVHNILTDLYFDAPTITDETLEGYYAPYKDKDVRDTLAIALTQYDDMFALSMLKSVRQKVLVFSGFDDKIHTEDTIRPFIMTLPHVNHIRVRNCGHFVHEEKPERFNSETLAFLTET